MNKSVKNLVPYLLLPTEDVAIGERVISIVSGAIQNDPFVTSELGFLNTSLGSLKSVIQTRRTGLYTADLAAKDAARVSEFRGVVSLLQGISGVMSKPDNKRAADYLLEIINRPGKRADNLSYTRKTGAFTSILANFGQPEAQACITQLGLADMLADLTKAQNDFETTYAAKVKAYSQQPLNATRTQANEVCYHIIKITEYIDAQAQNNSTFAGVVPEINEAISDIMSKARARKTRSKDANAAPASAASATNTAASVTATATTQAKSTVAPQPSNVVPITQKQEVTAKAA
jgi:hypothetical protein